MATWEIVLTTAGEHAWLLLVVVIVASVARTRPVRAVGWVLSNEIRDRYLRWKHVPDDERLRLITLGAKLEAELPAQTPAKPPTPAPPSPPGRNAA